jgi:nitrite reductase/ring-hydroxylating ferredoxin subunit
MGAISALEHAEKLDKAVAAGQRVVQVVPGGRVRDFLHGVWLGHPLHPVLVQGAAGAWLSASIIGLVPDSEAAARRLAAVGVVAAAPSAVAGAVDWSDQPQQHQRVGLVHACANVVAVALYSSSLIARTPRLSRALRLGGLAALSVSAFLGAHLSYRLASGVNHAEAVPHLIRPGWQYLMIDADLHEGRPARQLIGEVPVVAIRSGGEVHVLAERCSHQSGPLSEGEVADGCVTCPWHGSVFRLADGSVQGGPATAPQPAFETRVVGGAIQVRLPDAG